MKKRLSTQFGFRALALCLCAVVAILWSTTNETRADGTGTAPVQILLRVESLQEMDLPVLGLVNRAGPVTIYSAFSINGGLPIPANTTTTFTLTVPLTGSAPLDFTIMALYPFNTANNGVVVGSNSITPGTPWPFATQETAVAQVLTDVDLFSAAGFYLTNNSILGAPLGLSVQLLKYSDAQPAGIAYADVITPVPLPGTLLLFAPGLLGLAGLKRKYLG